MANKVIIVILVLLLIITGGIGYYSYTLNQQIDLLHAGLGAFEAEQTARVASVSNDLAGLRTETRQGLDSLEGQVAASRDDLDVLQSGLNAAGERISGVEGEIGGLASHLETLGDRIAGAESRLSATMIDANQVYQMVSRVTVRISNGQSTVGSGFILDTGGRVVTAHHVIDGLSSIYVTTHDGRVSRATVVGFSDISDVAVLQMDDNPGIEPLPLADSGQIKIGEPVIAVGSPFDLTDTLTAGIISQVNRFTEITYDSGTRRVPNLLQFDAAVNAGNSGCPLANASGEIIGLVIARIFPTEGDGIYYAVSANKVKRVVDSILATGSFPYPWIGVGVTDLTPQVVVDRALETANGALVDVVFSGGPAQAAGIQNGDIIVAFDGFQVRNTSDLTSYLGEFKSPGDDATLEVMRGTTRMQIPIVVGTRQ
ncbi:MAG: hypothetical protein A2Z05_06815 [Chloroflexi bacterium RBG_16_60_22]|nr:MAG: hypothetical protein A2Z05_06815 [Chloroflexi bacterium RBG_16_60_22]